jgi:hypothetical protein
MLAAVSALHPPSLRQLPLLLKGQVWSISEVGARKREVCFAGVKQKLDFRVVMPPAARKMRT